MWTGVCLFIILHAGIWRTVVVRRKPVHSRSCVHTVSLITSPPPFCLFFLSGTPVDEILNAGVILWFSFSVLWLFIGLFWWDASSTRTASLAIESALFLGWNVSVSGDVTFCVYLFCSTLLGPSSVVCSFCLFWSLFYGWAFLGDRWLSLYLKTDRKGGRPIPFSVVDLVIAQVARCGCRCFTGVLQMSAPAAFCLGPFLCRWTEVCLAASVLFAQHCADLMNPPPLSSVPPLCSFVPKAPKSGETKPP